MNKKQTNQKRYTTTEKQQNKKAPTTRSFQFFARYFRWHLNPFIYSIFIAQPIYIHIASTEKRILYDTKRSRCNRMKDIQSVKRHMQSMYGFEKYGKFIDPQHRIQWQSPCYFHRRRLYAMFFFILSKTVRSLPTLCTPIPFVVYSNRQERLFLLLLLLLLYFYHALH